MPILAALPVDWIHIARRMIVWFNIVVLHPFFSDLRYISKLGPICYVQHDMKFVMTLSSHFLYCGVVHPLLAFDAKSEKTNKHFSKDIALLVDISSDF